MLELDGVTVYHGQVPALQDVSLKVEKGQLVTLVGANGAGKTSLLRTISGFHRLRSGEIRFLGERTDGMNPHQIARLGITHVPEGRKLFPFMTVVENLEVGSYSSITRRKKSERELSQETYDLVFRIFPVLKERNKQLAGTLSGGEQQMLAIARGLMATPKILMLDEPSLGLAPIAVKNVFQTIRHIHEQEGLTMLLIEQNVKQALQLADNAYVLETGKIILAGKGSSLADNDYVRKAYLGL